MKVQIEVFSTTSREFLAQYDLDNCASAATAFLATLDPANVLDIKSSISTVGKYGSVAFTLTIIYLG